jgi:hypothetical protein
MKDVLQALQKENPGMIYPSPIHDTILRAIQTGDPSGVRLLAKCIVAVNKNLPKGTKDYFTSGTKRQKVSYAVCDAANRLERIPTWEEIQDEFIGAGSDEEISTRGDEGNFINALHQAGFGWLIPRRRCKRS